MSIIEIILTIGYIVLSVFVLIGLFFLLKFIFWIRRKIRKIANPGARFLNKKKLMGDLISKYGKGEGGRRFKHIVDELKKTGIK